MHSMKGFLIAFLLAAVVFSCTAARQVDMEIKSKGAGSTTAAAATVAVAGENNDEKTKPLPGFGDSKGFVGPGGGFQVPSFGGSYGGGIGAGYGGPDGGYTSGGILRPSLVCMEKGPCHKKKVTCPAKCFTYYSRSGKNYGGGGGGGGCTIDCEKNCVGYC